MTASPDVLYTGGEYLQRHPTWHAEDSAWKAEMVLRMIRRSGLSPRSVCDVGCGAGELLRELQGRLGVDRELCGYELSPQAYELCRPKANEGLRFVLKDVREEDRRYDVMLVIDVVEHVEDCFAFLRSLRDVAGHQIFHIPLDLSAQGVLRGYPLKDAWQSVGHLHAFTKETALLTLEQAGYRVLDWFYTARSIDHPAPALRSRIARWPRKALFRVHPDFAVRLMGGFSLMVLTASA
jgi:SAM-dependent methyltransferase